VVTGSVLGPLSASLLVVSQLECPVSFFGAASTSAPLYRQTPGTTANAPFGRPLRPAVAYGDGYSITPPSQGLSEPLFLFVFLALVNPIPSYA
jgi:hypothetical protein